MDGLREKTSRGRWIEAMADAPGLSVAHEDPPSPKVTRSPEPEPAISQAAEEALAEIAAEAPHRRESKRFGGVGGRPPVQKK